MEEATKDLLKLGREAYEKREYSRAESYLTRVLQKHNNFADVYNMLGVIYHDRGLFTKAQQSFEQALRINPRYTEAALNLAVAYNDLGRYAKAKEVFNQALSTSRTKPGELDPFVRGKIANMYADIGDVYVSAGLHQQAEAEYHKALVLGPGFVDIRLKLAQSLRDQGKQEEAIEEFRRILEDQPKFVAARIHLGVTLYSVGRKDEAAAQWNEVLRIDPGNKSCQMYLNIIQASDS